jgi:hypothetical protein
MNMPQAERSSGKVAVIAWAKTGVETPAITAAKVIMRFKRTNGLMGGGFLLVADTAHLKLRMVIPPGRE